MASTFRIRRLAAAQARAATGALAQVLEDCVRGGAVCGATVAQKALGR
jgi:hypothetical protein